MKRVMFIIIGLLILSGLYAAATNKISDNKSKEISTLNAQISSIQSQLGQLQLDVFTLSRKVPSYAVFTPADEGKGYLPLHANVGYFLVGLDTLKKYGNGYRATFSIGNPSAITFRGIKVKIQWGEGPTEDKKLTDWSSSLKSEEIDINKPLLPGVWNKVSVVLSPATANETDYICLALKTNGANLSTDLRENSD